MSTDVATLLANYFDPYGKHRPSRVYASTADIETHGLTRHPKTPGEEPTLMRYLTATGQVYAAWMAWTTPTPESYAGRHRSEP